jgi:hypothetical protein
VTNVNDNAPVANADTLTANKNTPAVYTATQLLGNDSDADNAVLAIASVTSGAGGTPVLNGDGTVTFTPTTDFEGAASFSYTVTDGQLTSNSALVTVNVAPNIAPALSDTAVALSPQNEDSGAPVGAVGTLVSSLVDLAGGGGQNNVTDPNSGGLTGLALTGADTTNGSWFYTINNGGSWAAVGAVSDGAARLLAANADTRLYFQPNANFNGTLATAITFRAWDQTTGLNGQSGVNASVNGGATAFSTATDTASLAINAVNDAPVNTVPPTQAARSGVDLTITGTSIADVDAASVRVTLSATRGVLSLAPGSTGALSFTGGDGTSDATMTFSGTKAAVNTALASLTYRSDLNFTGVDSVTLLTSDLGAAGSGGTLTDSDSIAVAVTSAGSLIDSNADGKSDIISRNSTNGSIVLWQMNGAQQIASGTLGTVGSTLSMADAHGDFNGDGRSDILWRDMSTGTVHMWQLNGTAVTVNASPGAPDLSWSLIAAHGDYNGDGKSDVLWRHSSGAVAMWVMNGALITTNAIVGNVATNWSIVDAIGDYNGDGRDDILWRASDGTVAMWQMNGQFVSGNFNLGNVGPSLSVVSAHGDYNGDGRSDILWRANDGTVIVWTMNGGTIVGNHNLGVVPLSWSIVAGDGDYNADNRSDILWRNSDGSIRTWEMNGGTILSTNNLGSVAGTMKIIDARADTDADGRSEILWRNDADGAVVTWEMAGAAVSVGNAGTLPTTSAVAPAWGASINGGTGNDSLLGTVGNDRLYGKGGNDSLTGNPGADWFVFDTTPNAATNNDTVTDFAPSTDRLLLSDVIFSAPTLARGVLAADQFVAGASPTPVDANDHILYNTSTGTVSYDPDGSGAALAVVFATLANQPALAATDIYVGLV